MVSDLLAPFFFCYCRKIAPTVLLDVPLDTPLMTGEIFGPYLPIITVSNCFHPWSTTCSYVSVEISNNTRMPHCLVLFWICVFRLKRSKTASISSTPRRSHSQPTSLPRTRSCRTILWQTSLQEECL
jgi:hypothetical protein